ncbi:MAG: protein kinase [Myxococcales bacterium]|nr:protein kinase [Myxococcales bacterium]
MAQIYLARMGGMADFERHVVLKTILANRANDRRFINMFLDEAKLAATLNHQNIAQVYEIDQADGAYFMAMEYVHGENCRAILETSIRQGIQIPMECALLIVSSAAAGLHHAHERKGKTGQALNIVHRDVSPANIMVGYDGSVKVLDFGIAKAEERYTQTVGSTIKGKYGYMSPEQCKGKAIDRRSDIFALGIVLYELTTQRRAFKGRDDFDTMKRIVGSELVLPSSLVPSYPPELEAIILKTLASDPDIRYATAQDLIEALDAFTQRAKLTCTNTAMARFMVQLFGEPREPWETLPADSRRALSSSPDASASVSTSVNDGEEFDSDDLPTLHNGSAGALARAGRAHAPTAPNVPGAPSARSASPSSSAGNSQAVVRTRTPSVSSAPSVSGGRVHTPTTPPPSRSQTSAASSSAGLPASRRAGPTTPPPLRPQTMERRPLSPSTPPPLGQSGPSNPESGVPEAVVRSPHSGSMSAAARRSPAELFGAPAPHGQPTPLQLPTSRAAVPALGAGRSGPSAMMSGPLSIPLVPPRTMTPSVPSAMAPLSSSGLSGATQMAALVTNATGPSPVPTEPTAPRSLSEDGLVRVQSSVMAPLPRADSGSSAGSSYGSSFGSSTVSSAGSLVGSLVGSSGQRADPSGAMSPLPHGASVEPEPPSAFKYRWVILLVLIVVVVAVGLMIALTLASKPAS